MPVFDLSTGKVMHIPRGKSLVQKFNPKTGKQEYHYEDGWGRRYDVPKFENAPKKAQEIMKAMKAHSEEKSEDSKNSGDVKEIQEDSKNSKNSNNFKDDVKTSEDVKKVDSEDSKDSEDVKSSDSEISKTSKDVNKNSKDSEGSGDSGDSDSEYTDSEGCDGFDAEDDILSILDEVYGNKGFELVQVKDDNNLKVFEVSDKKANIEKAKISKTRAPITIFDHILIFTLLLVFAGILTVTGYSDDVFKWIHEKTGVSWQTFGGKNWIQ